jgi:hypothetical protein
VVGRHAVSAAPTAGSMTPATLTAILSRKLDHVFERAFKATIASVIAWLLYRASIQLLIRRLARA